MVMQKVVQWSDCVSPKTDSYLLAEKRFQSHAALMQQENVLINHFYDFV